jgi:hypothetical protein
VMSLSVLSCTRARALASSMISFLLPSPGSYV